MAKISDLINNGEIISYSFEVTPDINEEEMDDLEFKPLFYSITWHAQVHECKNLDIAPLKLAKYLRNKHKNVLLHISCTNLKKEYLNDVLKMLINIGICNLLIILGENYDPDNSDFKSSKDLVLHIRQRTGKYFCIGVAGFLDREGSILHLKEKVKSGVDFILTQAFFDVNALKRFISDCGKADISIPIIPGIFPFETRKELDVLISLCKINATEDLFINLTNNSGFEIIAKLANEIIQQLGIRHLHFFTVNKMQRTANVLRKVIVVANDRSNIEV